MNVAQIRNMIFWAATQALPGLGYAEKGNRLKSNAGRFLKGIKLLRSSKKVLSN